MCEFLLARGAAPPPPGTPASVHVVRHARKVLHVQSISTWAPSCIGPYSQVRANTTGARGKRAYPYAYSCVRLCSGRSLRLAAPG